VLGIDADSLVDPDEPPPDEPQDYVLWPEHARAWALFMACENQWRLVVVMGGATWLGLDMPGVDVIRRAHRISDEDWGEVLWQLQVMESEAKTIRNNQMKRGG
jgi:hypothetical protein